MTPGYVETEALLIVEIGCQTLAMGYTSRTPYEIKLLRINFTVIDSDNP